jgi:sugar phosphate isomerase/epimerase
MHLVSCTSANFGAQPLGYRMSERGEGARVSEERFRPLPTFRERFGALAAQIHAMGFEWVDVWVRHVNWTWATDEHIAIAREELARHGLQVTSLAGNMGKTLDDFRRACRLAAGLRARRLGGNTPLVASDPGAVVRELEAADLVFGIENHPADHTPADILAKIPADAGGRIGTTVDTGWWATQGYDAAKAVRELGRHVVQVHLKDVTAPGRHETCRFGEGVVPLQDCVAAMAEIGFDGPVSVEHEPEDHDPTEDIVASREMLQTWLATPIPPIGRQSTE